MLPFYGHHDWHEKLKFQYSWNSEENLSVTKRVLPEVVNPIFGPGMAEGDFPVTHYVGAAGVGPDAGKLSADSPRAGLFGFGRPTLPDQIKDGASNTIAILGVSGGLGPWASGGQPTVRGLTQQPYVNGPDGFGTGQPDGMYVGMADGAVRFISKDVDPRIMEGLMTINGGEKPVEFPEPDEKKTRGKDTEDAPGPKRPDEKGGDAAEVELGAEVEPDKVVAEEIPAEIKAKLNRPLKYIQFKNIELGNLLHTIRQMADLEIRFDRAAMAKAAVTLDTPVTVELKDTTVGKLLSEALAQCFLTYKVRDGKLLVTSPDNGRGK
jgi:hypothetical protein